MHDVLAHRISLVSVHAGALVYRTRQPGGPELSSTEVAESAQVIRDNAHQALDELQEVLRVLRADGESTAPQPRLAICRTWWSRPGRAASAWSSVTKPTRRKRCASVCSGRCTGSYRKG
jgi:hypothetical protein